MTGPGGCYWPHFVNEYGEVEGEEALPSPKEHCAAPDSGQAPEAAAPALCSQIPPPGLSGEALTS